MLFGTRQVAVTSVNVAGVEGSAEIAAYPDQLELTSGVTFPAALAVPAANTARPINEEKATSLRTEAP